MELKNLNEVQLTLIACCADDSHNAISAAEAIIENAEKMNDALLAIFWRGMCSAITCMAFRKILTLIKDQSVLDTLFNAAKLVSEDTNGQTVDALSRWAEDDDRIEELMKELSNIEGGNSILESYFQYPDWMKITKSIEAPATQYSI